MAKHGHFERKTFRLQRPFNGKVPQFDGKLPSVVIALRWQRQWHFESKGRSITKAAQWQKPFDDKSPSMSKALRWQRQGHFEGKGPLMEKARAL
jgi:hypothetical protein